jgi:hypothetical protein
VIIVWSPCVTVSVRGRNGQGACELFMFGSCVMRNPESSAGGEVERDGVGAGTTLEPRRLS